MNTRIIAVSDLLLECVQIIDIFFFETHLTKIVIATIIAAPVSVFNLDCLQAILAVDPLSIEWLVVTWNTVELKKWVALLASNFSLGFSIVISILLYHDVFILL